MPILSFTTKVLQKRYLTEDVLFLSLSRPVDFNFIAGQFISIKIHGQNPIQLAPPISLAPKSAAPLRTFQMRSYSIFSPPSQQESLDLIVKIIPGGYASEVFSKTQVGDEFEVKGPLGHFVFDNASGNQEHWFIGAGTGVTPLYSMIKEHLNNHPTQLFKLIFGVRSKKNLFYHEEFQKMELTHPNFEYTPTLSRDEWHGAKGRVQAHLHGDLSGKTYYICGLKELIIETKELLIKSGVEPKNIRFERFN